MATAQTLNPQKADFPWEGPVPTGSFWDSLSTDQWDPNNHTKRSFIRAFTPEEMARMPLEASAGLEPVAKLALLEGIIGEKLATIATSPTAAAHLSRDDWKKYSSLRFMANSLLKGQNKYPECEANMREDIKIYNTRFTAKVDEEMTSPHDVSSMSGLAFLLVETGRPEEAEPLIQESLSALQSHPRLGYPSPQYLGTFRLQIETKAKMGRVAEAKKQVKVGYGVIEELGKGQYKVYEVEEKEAMDEVDGKIEGWAADAAKGE